MLHRARRTTYIRTLRVVPTPLRNTVHARPSAAKPGNPRTASEWTALVKVASGELNIAPSHRARLLALGLVQSTGGAPALTRHGRITLGLPE